MPSTPCTNKSTGRNKPIRTSDCIFNLDAYRGYRDENGSNIGKRTVSFSKISLPTVPCIHLQDENYQEITLCTEFDIFCSRHGSTGRSLRSLTSWLAGTSYSRFRFLTTVPKTMDQARNLSSFILSPLSSRPHMPIHLRMPGAHPRSGFCPI
jgi:hypothetical protein